MKKPGNKYRTNLEDARRKIAERKAKNNIIIPACKSARRRGRAKNDFKYFCSVYFKHIFTINFCDDQINQMKSIEQAIKKSGDYAFAAMRGGGKTSIIRCAALWSFLFGHSRYCVLVGATSDDAQKNLIAIKKEINENDKLFEDFPEICIPFRWLDNSGRRANTQYIDGKISYIVYKNDMIVAPQSKYNIVNSGSIIESRSIEGKLRGINYKGVRPDLALLDDIETEESVRSDTQTEQRKRKIDNDISGWGGAGKKFTVIYIGTIMDELSITAELTDEKKRGSFSGRRYQYVYNFPVNKKLWQKYIDIRSSPGLGGIKEAQKYYKENRKEMDEGTKVAWEQGFEQKYISAIEKYYAVQVDKGENGLRYCACELQNDPSMLRHKSDEYRLTENIIYSRLSNFERYRIPSSCTHLTAFIDIHGLQNHHYFMIIAWQKDFSGFIVNYGKYPDVIIGQAYPRMSAEAATRQALDNLIKRINDFEFIRDDGLRMTVSGLVDSGFGSLTNMVYSATQTAQQKNFFPSKGESVKGKDYSRRGNAKDIQGDNWRRSIVMNEKFKIPAYMYNSDYWKRFLTNRIIAPKGEHGSLQIYGNNPSEHIDLCRHFTSELPMTLIEKHTNREYEVWNKIPNRANHYFDCAVGNCVAASILGIKLPAAQIPQKIRKKRPRRVAKIGIE